MDEERPAPPRYLPGMSIPVEEAAALRLRALARVRGFRATPAALAEQARPYRGMPPGARVEVFRSRGRLGAVLVAAEVADPWVGGVVHRVLVDQDRRSPRARRWLAGALRELLAGPPPGLELNLAAADREHLAAVDDRRAHVHCAILAGTVAAARRGLGPVDVPGRLALEGLELRRLRPGEVDVVLEWKRAWFTRHPEFGRHCAAPTYLEAERAEMTGELARGDGHDLWVLARDGRPAGFFSFVVFESASWGRCASLDLHLTAPLQGRGLARVVYAHLVARMRARGVETLRGGSAQPGVLRLARVMGRPTVAWVIRDGPGVVPRDLLVGG